MLIVLTVAIVAGIIWYLYANADEYLKLLRVSLGGTLSLLAAAMVFPFINGLINTYMFRGLGAPLTQREGFFLAASATLANQLPLPGGILARGAYLKHKHGVSYAEYFSAALALFFLTVAVNGLIGLCVVLYWVLEGRAISPVLPIAFGAMAAALLVFWVPLHRLPVPAALHKWVDSALHGWTLLGRDRALLFKLLGLQTVLLLMIAIRYWLAFRMLSQVLSGGQALLLAAASVLTQLISIAPGGLGVREAIVGGLAVALGFDLTVSVAAVELDRVIATVPIVVIGWISTVALGRRIAET